MTRVQAWIEFFNDSAARNAGDAAYHAAWADAALQQLDTRFELPYGGKPGAKEPKRVAQAREALK